MLFLSGQHFISNTTHTNTFVHKRSEGRDESLRLATILLIHAGYCGALVNHITQEENSMVSMAMRARDIPLAI